MTKLDDVTRALRQHPGAWIALQRAGGAGWPDVAERLYVLSGVRVSERMLQDWARAAR